jgi:hypothetical protein
MTGFIAGAFQKSTGASFNLTLPAGAVQGGEVLVIAQNGSSTAISDAIAGSTVLLSAAANNMYVRVLSKVLTATDITNGFLAVTSSTSSHDFWILAYDTTITGFDSANSFPLTSSFFGTRGGVSQTTVTAPAVTPNSSGDQVLVISCERTTTTGTTVSSISQGTQDYYNEDTVNTNCSVLAARFTGPASGVSTGTSVITYSGASGNALAFLLPMTAALASATGQVTATGSAAGAQQTGASTAATVTASGTVSPAQQFAASAAGQVTASGAATPGATVVTASGTVTAQGSASGAANENVAAAGQITALGSAAGTQQTPVQRFQANVPMWGAHRGGSADWVEESMYAYQHAAAWNPDLALEISIWQCSTGEWVCSHDQTTGRMFGTNLDIPTSTWTALSALRTTVGGYPMAKLTDVLDAFASGTRVLFIDNKPQADITNLLALLATYGGARRFILKGFYSSTAWASAASANGYQSWGYWLPADTAGGNLNSTTAARWTMLGIQYDDTTAIWGQALGYGKPVLGHIIANTTQSATAFGQGATGLMVSGVQEVVPLVGEAASSTVTALGTAAGRTDRAGAVTATVTALGTVAARTDQPGTATAVVTASGTVAPIATQPGAAAGQITVQGSAAGSTAQNAGAAGQVVAAATAAGAVSASTAGTVTALAAASGFTAGVAAILGQVTVLGGATGAKLSFASIAGLVTALGLAEAASPGSVLWSVWGGLREHPAAAFALEGVLEPVTYAGRVGL